MSERQVSMPDVAGALAFAVSAFGDMRDRSDRLCIYHSIRVASGCDSAYRQILGALHDVVEDTHSSLAQVNAQFGPCIAEDLALMTRSKHETYQAYIDRMIVSGSADVLAVKIEDLRDNIRRCDGLYCSIPDARLKSQRYLPTLARIERAYDILETVSPGQLRTRL